ncbi:MAG: glutaredoxin family protein [Planctomycetaceae bacterium]
MRGTRDTPDVEPSRARAVLGSAGLFLAAVLVVLAVLDHTRPLDFMPVSWHANRSLWYLLTLVSFLGGAALLRGASHNESTESTSPANGPKCFERIVIYTRQDCPLCEEAKRTLAHFGDALPKPVEIDIDTDEHLKAKYTDCVPVVEFDGKVRFHGRVDPALLRRLVEAEQQQHTADGPTVWAG